MMSIDRVVRRALYRGVFPAVFPRVRRVPFPAMRRMLVIRCDAIGDMILTTPLVHALHAHNPSMKIWIAASDRNADVVACDPSVERVIVFEERGRLRRGAVSELRTVRFDAVLQCVTNSTTKYGVLARIIAPHAMTVALRHQERPEYGGLFSDLVDVPDMYERPFAEIVMEFAIQALGISPDEDEYAPRIVVEPSLTHDADAAFRACGIAPRTAVLVNLSAAQPRKRWPRDAYHALVARLEQAGLRVVLSATGDDREAAVALAAASHAVFLPATNIRHLAAIVAQCALVVTPDTAVVHVASATNTPVVGLYAEANSVVTQWLPYRVPFRAVRTEHASVAEMSVDDVFVATMDLIESLHHSIA